MKLVAPISRILLGLVFVVFSLNYFVPFIPRQPMPPEAMAFAGALVGSGLFTLIKGLELVAGIALLANRGVPLALAVLAPIIVGIVFFHVVLVPAGTGLAVVVLALELIAAWSYRSAFKPMLRITAKPDAVAHRVTLPASVTA